MVNLAENLILEERVVKTKPKSNQKIDYKNCFLMSAEEKAYEEWVHTMRTIK